MDFISKKDYKYFSTNVFNDVFRKLLLKYVKILILSNLILLMIYKILALKLEKQINIGDLSTIDNKLVYVIMTNNMQYNLHS